MQSFARKVLISKKPRENETKTNKTKNLRFGRTWDESWGPGRFPEKKIYIYLCVSVVFHCFLDLDFLCYPIYIYMDPCSNYCDEHRAGEREREG